jgi:hypothetical protein
MTLIQAKYDSNPRTCEEYLVLKQPVNILLRCTQEYACEAYNILRKSAPLILSLFHLMAGAAIPDICLDPEKAMLKLQVRQAAFPLSGPLNRSLCVFGCVQMCLGAWAHVREGGYTHRQLDSVKRN